MSRCVGCGCTAADGKQILGPRSPQASSSICANCVEDCQRFLADSPTRVPGGGRFCAFCAKSEDQAIAIVAVGPKVICDECVDAYRAAL